MQQAQQAKSHPIFLLYNGLILLSFLVVVAGMYPPPDSPRWPLKTGMEEDLKLYAALRQAQGLEAVNVWTLMIKFEDRFDSLFQYHAEQLDADWLMAKAIGKKESSFRSRAVSGCGAQGVMQLMPATDKEVDGVVDGFNVDRNIHNGIFYFQKQYKHFPEIPSHTERIKFALAAYNAGRGNVNKAIKLAQRQLIREESKARGVPITTIKLSQSKEWQTWDYVAQFLPQVTGPKHSAQTINYVPSVLCYYHEYKTTAEATT